MSEDQPSPAPPVAIDRRRYKRLRRFFFRAFLRLFVQDVLLNRAPLSALRGDPLPRWCELARRYRALAVEMGGVLIKLGQYLGTRVDLLPREVIVELKGLQDEVPAAPYPLVEAAIAEGLGRPVEEAFATIDPEPLGAASLAQVHAARLHGGEDVVVKVLRPGIESLVETDLAAVRLAMGWVKGWSFVRRRVDLDWLAEEFVATTRRELDLRSEGRHAERFAECFADDPAVHVPKIYPELSARRVLTEENVAFIKVDDHKALERAGIDRRALASKIYRVYMEQIFVHNFVHADPHPGNLFVRRRAEAAEDESPFQVIFIDFGMVAEVPERLRGSLRSFLIGLGARDARKVVRACSDSGLLLPGADLDELEEALESIFDRFWGADVKRLNQIVRSEAGSLWREFSHLLLETPIQIQADLTFTGRAFELLAGLATELDPAFNPWLETLPFAEGLASEKLGESWQEIGQELLRRGQLLVGLPESLARTVSLAQRGKLVVKSGLARDSKRQAQRLERSVDRLSASVAAAAVLLTGALLYGDLPWVGLALMAAGMLGLVATALRRWFS